jgi:hypothetical protein
LISPYIVIPKSSFDSGNNYFFYLQKCPIYSFLLFLANASFDIPDWQLDYGLL